MNQSQRRKAMERVLLDLASFRSLRVKTLCAEPFQRDISLPQLHLLASLEEQGPVTVSELAHNLSISLPSTSSIADRLEDRGFLTRNRETSDRRVVTVEITDKGREVVEEFTGLRREQMKSLMSYMTDDELSRFVDGLAAFRAALDRSDRESSSVRDAADAARSG